MNEREYLIQSINMSMAIMKQIHDLEEQIENLEDELEQKDKKLGCGTYAILGFLGFLALAGMERVFKGGLSGILYIVPLAAYSIFIIQRQNKVKKYKANLKQLNATLSGLQNDSVLSWLPMDYRTSDAFASIGSYISNGRADTLKEALNLYENEVQQQRVVDAAFLGAYYGNNTAIQ